MNKRLKIVGATYDVVKYYYFTYLVIGSGNIGNSIASFDNEFDILETSKQQKKYTGHDCIITFFHEISKEQFDKIKKCCDD